MITLRASTQSEFAHGFLEQAVGDLWEPWMREVDRLLEDASLLETVYEAQGKRRPKSRTRGRTQTPAEVALRLLILKHVRNRRVQQLLVFSHNYRVDSRARFVTTRNGCSFRRHN